MSNTKKLLLFDYPYTFRPELGAAETMKKAWLAQSFKLKTRQRVSQNHPCTVSKVALYKANHGIKLPEE